MMKTFWEKKCAIVVALLIVFQSLSAPYFALAQTEPAASGTSWKTAPPDLLNKTETRFPKAAWWEAFQDAPLNQFVQTALKNNPSLQAAKTQIAAAQAIAKSYRAPLLPTLSFDPQYNYNVYGQNQFIFPIPARGPFQAYQIPLDATYDVDLFGKNFARYRSSKKQIDVARYQYDTAQIELAGTVATVYFNIAKWRHLEALSQDQLEASRKLLSHGQGLLELGQATLFDIQNEQQRLDQAQLNVTQFSANRQVAENQLLALLGQSPNTQVLATVTPWEDLHWPAILPVGVPSELVVHRPDVAIAEAQLAAADLDVQAARKAFLPTLMFSGTVGYNAVGLKNLFLGTSFATFLAATFSQFILDGGRRRGELELRKAYYEQLLDNYQNSLINAFTDAENSLAVLRSDQIVYQDVTRQTESARAKAREDLEKYKAGIQGEPPWLASEVERLDYEKVLTQQKIQMLIDVVSVAKAMGGGFQAPSQVSKQ